MAADVFDAISIAEGNQEVETEEEYLAAWQLLLDQGLVWQLQGFFGRTAMALIKAGKIKAPRRRRV